MKKIFSAKKWKIKHKLTAAMYAVLIPVILGITAYIYIQSSKTVTQELSKAYQELTRTMDDSINYIAADIEDMITYIAINDDFRFVLNSRIYTEVWRDPLVWSNETPADFVTEMLSVKNYIRCFALYTENGIRPYLNTRKNESLSSKTDDIRELEVFQKSEESPGDLCLMYMSADDRRLFTTNSSDRIVFGKTIMSYDKEKKLGYLCAAIDAKEVEAIFEADRQEINESVYLLDEEGQTIVHSGQAESQELNFIRSVLKTGLTTKGYWETNQSYIFTSKNEDYRYSVFYIVPKENWTSRLKNVSKMPFVLAVILFFAAFPIFTYVTRFINIPLQRLHRSMLNLQEGDFKQQVNVYAEDEIGDVTKVYNEMVEKIDDLIDKNYVMALREKQSELDVLQAQINPHFLYNTLDSLYWDAYNTGNLELAENIMALSELFRLALSRGEGEVSVETECNLVENYLKIQKMRFENRMDYRINLLSEMRHYKIPKLILQPFVENAIVHGLENRGNLGMIRLHGYMEQDRMVFKITDNGVGMNEDQLNSLLTAEKVQYSNQRISRYAIRNVNERLKLRYGERFTLDITSTIGVGTTITIKLPLE